jgi:hypothetical protein
VIEQKATTKAQLRQTKETHQSSPYTNASSPWTCGCKLPNFRCSFLNFSLSSPLLPLVDNVWIKVKMRECKTKHINIYMSFSNRPNLVSKARSETKSTHMGHSIVKALPQVIYGNIGMWQSKFSDLSNFIKRWLTSNLKAYPCHILAKNMHIIQRSYKEIKFLTKDHCKHP